MNRAIRATIAMAALLAAAAVARPIGAAPQAGLAQARASLGGEAKLSGVKALQLTGQKRTRFNMMRRGVRSAEYQTEGEEIRMLFPDHYLIVADNRTIPGLGGSREGFAGAAVIGEGVVGKWRNPETFGYLALALLLRSDTVFPFTPKAHAPGTLTFADPAGVIVTVDLDPKTSRPLRLRFDAPLRANDGTPRGGTVPTRIELSDFRQTGGLTLPHTLARYQGADLITEQTFASIIVNPPLTRADFK